MHATATIHELLPSDVQGVAAHIYTEAVGTPPTPEVLEREAGRLRWLLLENPSNISGVPVGWLLRDESGAVVGAMTNTHLRVGMDNWTSTALMSAKFFVSQAHRGAGLGIFLRYLKLGRTYPLIATTAGAQSAPLWEKFGGFPISHSDHELVGIGRVGPLAEEVLHRRGPTRPVARAVGIAAMLAPPGLRRVRSAGAGVCLDQLHSARDAAEVARVACLSSPGVIAGGAEGGGESAVAVIRDEAHLHWRHFSGPDAATRRVLACTLPGGARVLVVAQIDRRGFRQQIRALSLQDLWGECGPEDLPRIAGALSRRFAGEFDLLVVRAQSPARRRALLGAGFHHRELAQSTSWCIDKHALAPTKSWYLVPADAE